MRSSFYDVYYAMDKDKRDYVAIKRIPSYADPMFLTNDRTISSSIDSNFITKYDMMTTNEKRLWVRSLRLTDTKVVTESSSMGSVASILCSDIKMDEEVIREVASCVLLGLRCLHDQFTVHRVRDVWESET